MKATSLHRRSYAFAGRQRGATLAIALIMLLVLTILGVTASRNSLTEERVAGNVQDTNVAFQVAEAALRDGEEFLRQPILPYFDGADGLYQPAPPTGAPRWSLVDWSSSTAVRNYTGMSGAPGSLSNASAAYIIEEMPNTIGPGESLAADVPVDEPKAFRITARGVGIAGNARVTLQSTYKR